MLNKDMKRSIKQIAIGLFVGVLFGPVAGLLSGVIGGPLGIMVARYVFVEEIYYSGVRWPALYGSGVGLVCGLITGPLVGVAIRVASNVLTLLPAHPRKAAIFGAIIGLLPGSVIWVLSGLETAR